MISMVMHTCMIQIIVEMGLAFEIQQLNKVKNPNMVGDNGNTTLNVDMA